MEYAKRRACLPIIDSSTLSVNIKKRFLPFYLILYLENKKQISAQKKKKNYSEDQKGKKDVNKV